jgi:alpha-L-rhamnosidase
MNRILCCFLIALSIPASRAQTPAAPSITSLRQQFLNPPDDAKPMMRWWWFGVAGEKPEILRELQQMKADGIGGVELAFVYPQVVDDPAKGLVNEPFVSPEMLDNVRYAQDEARKLGLRVDVTLGSGWPYGGPATTLAEAATRLRTIEVPVPANAKFILLPKFEVGESLISASIAPGEPKQWSASSAEPLPLMIPHDTTQVVLEPSAQPRVALFFVASHTKQQVKRAAVGAEGWVLDPFSHDAVATHLRAVGEPLVKAFGPTPPYAIFSDSLEAYGADWTPNLPAEFKKRRGYDLLPHLPELVSGGTSEAERVRHDWGQTLTELVNQNYLTQINHWAIAHHTKFRSQTYGEPAVDLDSQRLVALPEGEGPHWRAFSTLRWASSANHLFGNNITSGESFTWLHSPVFRATPLDMKVEADLDFIMGQNQIIGHGWPYSAPQVGEPGWSLYAPAVFNDHNPWHPLMPDVARYIQRICYLLRQGKPANQVALLLPTDDAWAHFSPGEVTVTGEMTSLISPALMFAILDAGYNVDFIDAKTINRLGIHHPILVLPPTDRIPLETLRKIQQYAATGGKVIAVGRAPSSDADGQTTPEFAALSKQLLEPAKTLGGDMNSLTYALNKAAKPDFYIKHREGPQSTFPQDELGFIRRKLPNADIYFVANTSNSQIDTTVFLSTRFLNGEAWNPDAGISTPVSPVCLPLHLAPYESRVFVFSGLEASRTPITPADVERNYCGQDLASRTSDGELMTDLNSNWNVTFASTGKSELKNIPTDWASYDDTKFYSGEVVFKREFTLSSISKTPLYLEIEGGTATTPNPPITQQTEKAQGIRNPLITKPGPGLQAWYDPPIREAAIVYINGQRGGSLWHPPYRLEVTKLLRQGQNHIEIHVYNTAINAWAAQPPHDYKPLIAKYGDRFQMQDLDKVKPVPSGILGSIHLVTASK